MLCREPWRTDPTRLTTYDTCYGGRSATLQRAVAYRSRSPYHARHMLRRNIAKSRGIQIPFALPRTTCYGGRSATLQRAVAYRSHSPYHARHMPRRKECNIAKSRGVQTPLALPRTTHATAQHCKEPCRTDPTLLTTCDTCYGGRSATLFFS